MTVLPWNVALPFVIVVLAVAGGTITFFYYDKTYKEFMARYGEDIEIIREGIQSLLHRLPRFQRRTSAPAVDEQGPIYLTDLGKGISETVCASEWAMKEAPLLAEGAHGKQDFEILDICYDHVLRALDDDPKFQERVRAGARAHCTDPENVREVLQVELRDAVLRLIRPGGPVQPP